MKRNAEQKLAQCCIIVYRSYLIKVTDCCCWRYLRGKLWLLAIAPLIKLLSSSSRAWWDQWGKIRIPVISFALFATILLPLANWIMKINMPVFPAEIKLTGSILLDDGLHIDMAKREMMARNNIYLELSGNSRLPSLWSGWIRERERESIRKVYLPSQFVRDLSVSHSKVIDFHSLVWVRLAKAAELIFKIQCVDEYLRLFLLLLILWINYFLWDLLPALLYFAAHLAVANLSICYELLERKKERGRGSKIYLFRALYFNKFDEYLKQFLASQVLLRFQITETRHTWS